MGKIFSKFLIILFFCINLYADNFDINAKVVDKFVNFNITLENNSYVYADKLKFSFDNGFVINDFITFPKSKIHKNYKVFDKNFEITLPLSVVLLNSNVDNFKILVSAQGCSYDDFCFNPLNYEFDFIKKNNGYEITKTALKDSSDKINNQPSNSEDEHNHIHLIKSNESEILYKIEHSSAILAILSFFGFGILLSLTPCNLPLVPIISSIIMQKNHNPILSSSVYVIGLSLAYGFIGLFVSFLGLNLANFFQIPAIIILFSVIFVILSLSSFGLFEISMPSKIQTLISQKSAKFGGLFGIFVMGFFSSLIVGPCVAPPLSGALIFISKTGNLTLGFLLLFFMGLGIGAPLMILALLSKRIKTSEISERIEKFLGFILLFMAIFMLSRLISEELTLILYGILCTFLGVYIGFDKYLNRCIAILVIMLSGILILKSQLITTNQLNHTNTSEIKFIQIDRLSELDEITKSSKKPVLLDITADWCVSCKEVDNEIFKNPNVMSALSNYENVRLDITQNSKDKEEILKKFNIFGPPAILIFKNNKLYKKFVGEVKANEFLKEI